MTIAMLRKTAALLIVWGFAVLYHSETSFAASTLTLNPSGEGVFVLQGVGMEDVAAMDIGISYDTSSLANPQVKQGGLISGAMMAVNPNVRGVVRIGIITTSPIRGTGVIATLTFDRIGSLPGKIISLKATLANINGNPLSVQTLAENASNASATASEPSMSPSSSSSDSSRGVSSLPGTEGRQSLSGGALAGPPAGPGGPASPEKQVQIGASDPNPVTVQKTPEVIAETGALSTQASASTREPLIKKEEKKIYTQKSVLDRFKEYKGERSPKALVALFNLDPLIGFRQEPALVLSDGKKTAKVIFIAFADAKRVPDVSLSNAQRLSLKKDPDNTNMWIAEVLPDKKCWSAALTLKQDKVNMVFPLIVAPKIKMALDKSGRVPESAFSRFLSKRDKTKKLNFDLNKDGKKDFVDDFIFTANYIVVNEGASKKRSSAGKAE